MRIGSLIFFLFLFQLNVLLGQSLTKEYLDQWIQMSQPHLEFSKKEKIYILEGVFYDSTSVERKLTNYSANERFLSIEYFLFDSILTTIFRPNLLIVTINQAPTLKLKEKKKELGSVENMFSDKSKNPVLIINNKQLTSKASKRIISALKARNIDRIIILEHAPLSTYGESAKNGLIKICTKN